MAVQTTTNLSNSITAVYKGKYLEGAARRRFYDQFAVDYTELGADGKSMDELMRGSSIVVPFLSEMVPGTTAISQTADVTPQSLVDTTASVTPTSRGEALLWSENLEIQVYTDYTARAYERVGANAMESIEILAEDAWLAGTWVERAAARSSLDAGTASHRASDSVFRKYEGMFQTLNVPGFVGDDGSDNTWGAAMHPFVFHDISESGNVDVIGQYMDKGIHLNMELASIGPFRLIVDRQAKVMAGAGATNATSFVDGVGTASAALATTLVCDSTATNAAYGLFLMVGTPETSTTFYSYRNERFKYLSGSSATITLLGSAPNGGLRWAHAVTETVNNSDSVYTILFAGPQSLVRVYATNIGPYGLVGQPKTSGLLDQFHSLGWKYYGNYGLISQNRVMRWEGSTSYEA